MKKILISNFLPFVFVVGFLVFAPMCSFSQNDDGSNLYLVGLKAENSKSYKKALEWYLKAVNKGDSYGYAEEHIGQLYQFGEGVTVDYKEATNWYQKAAKKNNPYAETQIGFLYEMGYGVPKDYQEAMKWYLKAANQSNGSGERSVGVLYENGRGVKGDYQQALGWYQKAITDGDNEAPSRKASLLKMIASEPIKSKISFKDKFPVYLVLLFLGGVGILIYKKSDFLAELNSELQFSISSSLLINLLGSDKKELEVGLAFIYKMGGLLMVGITAFGIIGITFSH